MVPRSNSPERGRLTCPRNTKQALFIRHVNHIALSCRMSIHLFRTYSGIINKSAASSFSVSRSRAKGTLYPIVLNATPSIAAVSSCV